MYHIKQARALQQHLENMRASGRSIGFIPTMGALHEGHLSLIRQAQTENMYTVCSIFVNPTQFNDPADLEKYPRTPGKDIRMLASVGTDVLFMPHTGEIYPPGMDTVPDIDFQQLDQIMEGEFRPGHFRGVAQVVKRLLDIVQPDAMYMGQKDYQQVAIIRHMTRTLKLPARVVMCPTIREADGLAMSSRNVRLSPEQRALAPAIHQTLQVAKEMLKEGIEPEDIEHFAMGRLLEARLRPEYFEVVDGHTLLPVEFPAASPLIVACTAVWAGDVRLIDNLILKEETEQDTMQRVSPLNPEP